MNHFSSRWIPRMALALLAVVCVGLLPSVAQAALTDPGQIMNEAYISLVQGDQSLDAARLDEALALYVQAQEYYQRLARDFPGFEPRIIQYRKTYCDNQITDINRKLAQPVGGSLPPLEARAPAWPPPAAPIVTTAPLPSASVTGERSVEIDYLKSRIDSLEAELAEHDTLQEEVDRLAAANQTLNQQLEQARRQVAERASGDQEAVQTLRTELAAKDEQLQALQRDLEAKRQLDQALNDMEAKVSELRTMTERLNEEIKNLDLELDDAEIRVDQAELRANQAEKKLAEAEARVAIAEEELQVARAMPPPTPVAIETAKAQKSTSRQSQDKSKKSDPVPSGKSASADPAPQAERVKTALEFPQASPTPSAPPTPIPNGMSAADFVRQLLQEGQNEAALATIQNARRAARSDMNLGLIEGIALIRLQRYSDAATLLIDIAKQNPRNAEVHATLGAAMMGAGFYDEARDTLQMAIGLDKNLPECQYNLAQLYAFIEPINLRLAARHYRTARNLGVAPDTQLEAALK